ncbi:MAG TPA: hypothetical protein VH437_24905 [Terriglobales bacterium]
MRSTWMLGICLLIATRLLAQSSSTSTSESQGPSGVDGIRRSENHTESDGRTTNKQSLERMGMDGRYVPYLDVEKESIRVNATTVRTIERTYGRDPDGRKTLTQVVEEEKNSLPDGTEKVVRNTSNPDADGRLQLIRRETEDTKQSSANVQIMKATAYSVGSDGRLVPSSQSEERRTRTGDHDTQFRRSTLLPDLNGNWQLQEVHEGVIRDDGKERTTEEQILRPDNDGRMTVVDRTVNKEPLNSEEGKSTQETYSTTVPGSADAGRLQLTQRVTNVRRKTLQGGTITEQEVSQRNPGAPNDGVRPTQKTIDIVRPTSAGGTEHQTQTISIDANGGSNVVWVDVGKSTSTVQVDTSKPQESAVDKAKQPASQPSNGKPQ